MKFGRFRLTRRKAGLGGALLALLLFLAACGSTSSTHSAGSTNHSAVSSPAAQSTAASAPSTAASSPAATAASASPGAASPASSPTQTAVPPWTTADTQAFTNAWNADPAIHTASLACMLAVVQFRMPAPDALAYVHVAWGNPTWTPGQVKQELIAKHGQVEGERIFALWSPGAVNWGCGGT